jgi:RNase H-fold protein (predicted Holliday junction resolvase)
MKLHREPRLGGVNDAFIGSIVGIDLGYKSCGRFVQERKNEICRLMNNLKKLNRTFHLSQ